MNESDIENEIEKIEIEMDNDPFPSTIEEGNEEWVGIKSPYNLSFGTENENEKDTSKKTISL